MELSVQKLYTESEDKMAKQEAKVLKMQTDNGKFAGEKLKLMSTIDELRSGVEVMEARLAEFVSSKEADLASKEAEIAALHAANRSTHFQTKLYHF
jgi:hypothetical protein